MCMMPQMGYAIASLSPGDEIIIRKGFGDPKTEKEIKDIIYNIHCFSALTANGIQLMCRDAIGIKRTGKHFTEYDVSPEAKKILKEANVS